ncbi:MAG: hypothetical protein ACM3P0_17670 [Acidobacteriota bacterium]
MNKSIWGSAAPKFIYDMGGANETEVLLDRWITIEDEPEAKEVILESELEADRDISHKGSYWTFSGKLYLFKYNDPLSKFNEVYQFLNQKVVLYKHRDGEPFKDKDGNNALFFIEEITPKNMTTLDYRDVLIIKFISLKAISFANSTPIKPQLSEITMSKNL